MSDQFFGELAELSTAEQLRVLAAITGSIIRETAEDHHQARDAVDKLLTHIERAAGLRL